MNGNNANEVSNIRSHEKDYNTFTSNNENNQDNQIDNNIKNHDQSLSLVTIKSIITLSLTAIGASYIVIPCKVQNFGLFWFSLILMLISYSNYFTCSILLKLGSKHKIYNYTSLINFYYGKKVAGLSCLILLFGCLGLSVLYTLITYNLYLKSFPNLEAYRTLFLSLIVLFVVFPICLINDISKLSFTSTLTVISLVYLVFIICVQSPIYLNNYAEHYSNYFPNGNNNKKENKDLISHFQGMIGSSFQKQEHIYQTQKINEFTEIKQHTFLNTVNFFNIMPAFTYQLLFFSSYSTMCFGLSLHVNILNIVSSLENKNTSYARMIIKNSHLLVGLLCFLVCVFGYLTVPINTPSLIYNRYELLSSDVLIEIGIKLLTLFLIFKIPLMFNAAKHSICGYLYNGEKHFLDLKYNFILTSLFCGISAFISINFPKIDDILSIVGGSYSISFSMTFPLLMLYSSKKQDIKSNLKQKYLEEEMKYKYNPNSSYWYQSNKQENNILMTNKIQNGIHHKNNYVDGGNKDETILLNQGNTNNLNKDNNNNNNAPSNVIISPISESLSANSKTTFINIDGENNEKLEAENLNDSLYHQYASRKKYIKKYFKMRNVFASLFSEYGFILVIVMCNILIGYFTVILVIRKVLFMNK